MKPIIGIISRPYYSATNKKINTIYNDIITSVIKSRGIPIGIPNNEDITPYLSICKGFIFQGGDDIEEHNLKTIKILKEKNIPTLGICLGMQEMFYHKNLIDIQNTKYQISAISQDNITESIEDPNTKFFLGLQWHPENLYNIDSNSRKIFDYFIKICNN